MAAQTGKSKANKPKPEKPKVDDLLTLSAEDTKRLDRLSLCLSFGEAPFRLLPAGGKEGFYRAGEGFFPEDNLGAEEWAWQFLRLNKEYREAFEVAERFYRDRDLPVDAQWLGHGGSGWALKHTREYDELHCRSVFGLSAWLNPDGNERLPELPKGGSWFFPLRRIGYSALPARSSWVPVREGVFKYHLGVAGPFALARGYIETPVCWFRIDCSVPPKAQLESLREVAEAWCWYVKRTKPALMASRYRGEIESIGCGRRERGPLPVVFGAGTNLLNAYDLPDVRSEGANGEIADFWREVRIDCLKALQPQIRRAEDQLLSLHERLLSGKRVRTPVRQRFHYQVSTQENHVLKAILITHQLTQQELTVQEMERFLRKTPNGVIRQGPWGASGVDNDQRLRGYVEDGRLMVEGGYKWLVHAGKPHSHR